MLQATTAKEGSGDLDYSPVLALSTWTSLFQSYLERRIRKARSLFYVEHARQMEMHTSKI